MKLACVVAAPEVGSLSFGWPGDLGHVLPALAGIGYEGVELQVRDPSRFDVGALAARIHAAGLTVTGIGTGPVGGEDGLFLTSPDAGVRSRAITRLTSILEVAAELGVHLTIGGVRGRVGWSSGDGDAMAWFRTAIEELLARAETLETQILLEPQNRSVTDFLQTVGETIGFLDAYPSPYLGLLCDTYHMASEEPSVIAALVEGRMSGRMNYVQVADSNRRAPGAGFLNWQDIVGVLRALDYDGWLTAECLPVPTSASSARDTYRFLADIAGAGR
jgi:sugar phosphate isomerase/epimerase